MKRIAALLAATAASSTLAASPWVNLIGADLSTWTQRGGVATYRVADGTIVGRTVLKTGNSFLCTPYDLGDFVLEYDVKVNPDLNSGVQIRSHAFAEETTFTGPDGKVGKVPAGRVHGYQMEIDNDPKKDRWWTAGLYEEGRRGWLFPGAAGGEGKAFTDQGRQVTKAADWNQIRVTAIGGRIRSWLNGAPRTDVLDPDWPAGFLALQVHGIGSDATKDGIEVAWRNLRVLPLGGGAAEPNTLSEVEQREGWKLLWDGQTSAGWRSARAPDTFPTSGWEMKDGLITVMPTGGKESAAGGDIITKEQYSSFILKVDFRLTDGANSGIKYFVDPELNKGSGSAIGCEFQVLDDEKHPDAKLGKNGNRTIGSLYDVIPAAASKRPNPIGAWNQALIIVDGAHVEHWLNGEKVVEYERGSPEFRTLVAGSKFQKYKGWGESPAGHILLQDHGNQVSYRNIKIKVLDR